MMVILLFRIGRQRNLIAPNVYTFIYTNISQLATSDIKLFQKGYTCSLCWLAIFRKFV